ncbi:MAG: hypothetical protein JEZ11_14950 [Desulfobacterales bacterium]|nr:hypothetical protein [Desulfobacterales bacterium]
MEYFYFENNEHGYLNDRYHCYTCGKGWIYSEVDEGTTDIVEVDRKNELLM